MNLKYFISLIAVALISTVVAVKIYDHYFKPPYEAYGVKVRLKGCADASCELTGTLRNSEEKGVQTLELADGSIVRIPPKGFEVITIPVPQPEKQ